MFFFIPADAFKSIAPPVELYDFPLFFPKPNFRGRPPPMGFSDSDDEEKPAKKITKQKSDKSKPATAEFVKKFNLYSKGKASLPADEAAGLARSEGLAPSLADIAALEALGPGAVTPNAFEKWRDVYVAPHKTCDTPRGLKGFFENFDTGLGTVTRLQLRNMLGSYGEALTPAEVDGILAQLNITGDTIDYTQFIELLLKD